MAKKGKIGRPEITIDWDSVDQSLVCGSLGTEIAAKLGIHEDTLYRACDREKDMLFSAYAAKMRSKGDDLLRDAQMKNALSGNTTMQVWLGKQRLKQRDDPHRNEFTQDDRERLTKMSQAIEAGIAQSQQQSKPASSPIDLRD